MASGLEALPKGYELPSTAIELSEAWVRDYVAAVEDTAIADVGPYVPPMALGVLALRDMLSNVSLPSGAIHAGQELSFRRTIRTGEKLAASAGRVSRGERQGWALMIVEMRLLDGKGLEVMEGRSTVTFPVSATSNSLEGAAAVLAPNDEAGARPLTSRVREVTQAKIDRYAQVSGDHNPLHIDPEFALRTQFGGPIAHGMLILAYLSEVLTAEFGLDWLSSGHLKARFRAPTRPSDMVTTGGSFRRSDGVASGKAWCANQRNELLVSSIIRVG